jgi:hypothetical protein
MLIHAGSVRENGRLVPHPSLWKAMAEIEQESDFGEVTPIKQAHR